MTHTSRRVSLLSFFMIALTAVLSCSLPFLEENQESAYTTEQINDNQAIPVCANGAVKIIQQSVGYTNDNNTYLILMTVSNTGEGYAHNLAVNVTALRQRNEEGDWVDYPLSDDSPCNFFVETLNPGESRELSCGIPTPGRPEAVITTQTCQYLSANEQQDLTEQDTDKSGDSQDAQAGNDGKYANPNSSDGAYRVVLGPNPEGTEFEAAFVWKNFWTNLPDNQELDCQATGSPNEDVYAYLLDDFTLTLDYYLDEKILKGNITAGQSNFDATYEKTDWGYDGQIENGWVRGNPDMGSWEFGGDLIFNIDINDAWRCWKCTLVQGGCLYDESWETDSKATQINGQFFGSTNPDGTYSFSINYEDENTQFVVQTLRNQKLPEGFPLP